MEILVLAVAVFLVVRDGQHHQRWAIIFVAVAISVIVHVSAFAIVSRPLGLTPECVFYFFGGALVRLRIGRTWWVLGSIPLGGSVKFANHDDGTDRRLWSALSWPARALLPLAGPALSLAFAFALLGPRQFARGIGDFPAELSVLFDQARRPELAAAFLRLLDHGSPVTIIGRFAVAMAMINLLPSPMFNGGQSIQFFVEGLTGRRPPNQVVMLVVLATLIAFLLASILFVSAVAQRWTA